MALTEESPLDLSNFGINYVLEPGTSLPEAFPSTVLCNFKKNGNTITYTKHDNVSISLTIDKQLQHGSFGQGYRIVEKINGKSLFLKRIRRVIERDKVVSVKDFIVESVIQILIFLKTKDLKFPEIDLEGPFTSEIFQCGCNDTDFYIISERLDSTLVDKVFNQRIYYLDDYMKQQKLLINYTIQTSRILIELQKLLQFNHRDLKTDNLMIKNINGMNNIRLIDFGLSCLTYNGVKLETQNITFKHCFLESRDLSSLFYNYLIDIKNTDRRDFKILLTILLGENLDSQTGENWGYTYRRYNTTSENPNLNPQIVYTIFTNISILKNLAIDPSWGKYLKRFKYPRPRNTDEQNYVKAIAKNMDSSLLTGYLEGSINFDNKQSLDEAINIYEKRKNIPEIVNFINDKFKNYINGYSETILLKLIREKNYSLIQNVMEIDGIATPEFISKKTSRNETILHYIARYGTIDLDRILNIRTDKEFINTKNSDGETCLHYIAMSGNVKQLDRILSIGPNEELINAKNNNGESALRYAFKHGRKEIISKLIDITDIDDGEILLEMLFQQRYYTFFSKIIDTPSTQITVNPNRFNVLHYYLNNLKNEGQRPNRNSNTLSIVDELSILDKILEKNSTPEFINNQNQFGVTPLMLACQKNRYNIVQKLLSFPFIKTTIQDKDGDTALHYASRKNATEIVDLLINRNPALVNIKNIKGRGPGNPNIAATPAIRSTIKSKKLMFGKHKNTNMQGGRTRRHK